MRSFHSLLLLGLVFGAVAAPVGSGDNPFLERYLAKAERKLAEGEIDAARAAIERALERDDRHLGALRKLAEVCVLQDDLDAAVYAWHRWFAVVDASAKPPVSKSEIKAAREILVALDPRAEEFRTVSSRYVDELLGLAKEHLKRKRHHSALALYQEILQIDPLNEVAANGLLDVRRKGGADVATEDLYAGTDPTGGASAEWVSEQDERHKVWDDAWVEESENYRLRTDAGYLVLKTSAIAMEQMNRAYRQFFRYKLDGDPTPRIDVYIFKNRKEYLDRNGLPENDWTGGFFNGGSVQTFLGGPSGKETIRQMYGTLFHEAAHQFVSLTGKGGVPGWMNEGYASFFEGTTILSNGSVKWNQVAQHRLFPLATRMENGWLDSVDQVKADDNGDWPAVTRAPTLRQILEGGYSWGPPWYAPTWGVIYFLYNYHDEVGRPIYRDALHEYYLSGAAGRGDPAAHFEEVVLAAPLSKVADIDALSEVWRTWILELRDVQLGLREAGRNNLEFGDAALARGEKDLALEFYEEAHAIAPENAEATWKLAVLLEGLKELDRAAALYQDFARELELRGEDADERYPVARKRMEALDPLHRQHNRAKKKVAEDGMELARSYRERGMPLMAMEITRRMSANFSMPEALALYAEVARESGRSLARWKVAYNEYDLDGWSGSGTYRAYGVMIEGAVLTDAVAAPEGSFQTQELACDVTFEADFSLEAEMRFEGDASLMGLCFGRKDDSNTHAVVLHPKGYLDVSTKNGGVWSVRDHRAVRIDREWQKLRIDVVERTVDVYLNDRYIRSVEMPSRESVRGSFGLITGKGTCYYQNVRLLARDPHDPAARIERELLLERLAAGDVERPPGTFSGTVPPPLVLGEVLQGEFPSYDALRGRPVVLLFWSLNQDRIIPTAEYYAWLARRYEAYGYHFLLVVSSEDSAKVVREYLEQHPMPGVALAMDSSVQTFHAFNLKADGWGLPRNLVLDVDGAVIFEGDPGLKAGLGWDPLDEVETFLDGPLEDLLDTRRLKEIAALDGVLESGQALFEAGRLREALAVLEPLADLPADFDPEVRSARDLRGRIGTLGHALLVGADQALAAGRPLQAAALLEKASLEFANSATGDQAGANLKKLVKDARHKAATKSWRALEKAAGLADRGRDAGDVRTQLQLAEGSGVAEIDAALAALGEALAGGGTAAMLQVWNGLQPRAELPEESAAGSAER
ncbi:MAG TPA: family 16 glycoside hydrolase [Planctomycetota bacterium]